LSTSLAACYFWGYQNGLCVWTHFLLGTTLCAGLE
jgi:hypothetical protein